MEPLFDTIAAICTAPGAAGIAVVRLSGPGCLAAAARAFRGHGPDPSTCPSHTIHHGFVVSAHGESLDEVLLLIMRGPRSFTGEDVVEFHCHGGHVPAARCLQRLLECGARPATPGEFTRRAFLNGRIDLTQAEAVLDLIRAHSERSADLALRQLRGALRGRLASVRKAAMGAAADLAAALDFPEDEAVSVDLPRTIAALNGCSDQCRSLAASFREGHLLRDGIRVVIAGRPNAGKSSLFNLLVGDDRAIVSPRAGTTRDTIETWLSFGGFPVLLVDTAGIATSSCEIEQDGVRRTMNEISCSDMVIYVIDSTEGALESDLAILRGIRPEKVLVVRSKSDLVSIEANDPRLSPWNQIVISCIEQIDRQRVVNCIVRVISKFSSGFETEAPAVSERHRVLLEAAAQSFLDAAALLRSGRDDGPELASAHIRNGAESLDTITGARFDEELLNRIFSSFCIGK